MGCGHRHSMQWAVPQAHQQWASHTATIMQLWLVTLTWNSHSNHTVCASPTHVTLAYSRGLLHEWLIHESFQRYERSMHQLFAPTGAFQFFWLLKRWSTRSSDSTVTFVYFFKMSVEQNLGIIYIPVTGNDYLDLSIRRQLYYFRFLWLNSK